MDLDHYYATRIAQERTNHQPNHIPTNLTRVRTSQRTPITAHLRTFATAIRRPNRRIQPSTIPTSSRPPTPSL